MKKLLNNPLLRQMVLYGLIGVGCAGTDTALFSLLTCFTALDPQISNCISSLVGICLSFLLNVHFNFKVNDHLLRRGIRFFAVGLLGLAISSGILAWSQQQGFLPIPSKVAAVIIVAVIQFILNKLVSFRKI